MLALAVVYKKPRFLFPPVLITLCFAAENYMKFGNALNTPYLADVEHGFVTIMPFSGEPGFSYPIVFGALSILFSFGKGLIFFIPSILFFFFNPGKVDPQVHAHGSSHRRGVLHPCRAALFKVVGVVRGVFLGPAILPVPVHSRGYRRREVSRQPGPYAARQGQRIHDLDLFNVGEHQRLPVRPGRSADMPGKQLCPGGSVLVYAGIQRAFQAVCSRARIFGSALEQQAPFCWLANFCIVVSAHCEPAPTNAGKHNTSQTCLIICRPSARFSIEPFSPIPSCDA
jgi:hypothetical protein